MKKLFRVFCLIGIVFFLGMNVGYAMEVDGGGAIKNYKEMACLYDKQVGAYKVMLIQKKDGTLLVYKNKYDRKMLDEKEGWYRSNAIPKWYDEVRIANGELTKCPSLQNTVTEGGVRFKFYLKDGDIGNDLQDYTYEIDEVLKYLKLDISNAKSCEIKFPYADMKQESLDLYKTEGSTTAKGELYNGISNIISYYVYNGENLILKDKSSINTVEGETDLFDNGRMKIQSYIDIHKATGTYYANDLGYLYYYSKLGSYDDFVNSYIEELEKSNYLVCPKYTWCQEKENANNYYLELGDGGNELCLSNGYNGKISSDGNKSDVITDEEFKEYWEDPFGNFIDVNKPINFADCEELLSGKGDAQDVIKFLKFVLWAIRIIVPLLLIGLGTLDFVKAIFAGEDNMKKAQAKFVKRVVLSVVVMLIPSLLKFILTIANGIWPDIISPDFCGIL